MKSPRTAWRRMLVFAGLLAAWHIASELAADPVYVPGPWETLDHYLATYATTRLSSDLLITMYAFASGYVIGAPLGVVSALLVGRFRDLADALYPFAAALSAHRLLYVPLFFLYLGFGPASAVVWVSFVAFMVVFTNALHGMGEIDSDVQSAADPFGIRQDRAGWTRDDWNATIPWITSALRLALTQAFVAELIREYLGSTIGLGFAIIDHYLRFDVMNTISLLLTAVIVLAVMGALSRVIEAYVLGRYVRGGQYQPVS